MKVLVVLAVLAAMLHIAYGWVICGNNKLERRIIMESDNTLKCGSSYFPAHLEYLAWLHTVDQDKGGYKGFSWSGKSKKGWSCNYDSDPKCMWDKMRQSTGRSTDPDVFEISLPGGTADYDADKAFQALKDWPPYYAVIKGTGYWKGLKSVGCWMSKKNTNCWFAKR